MRARADADRVDAFVRALGRSARREDATLYLTGGATAVVMGWRATTIDVDIRIEPEQDELLRAIPKLKEELEVNVELASPLDFLPELPGWRDRSPFILRVERLDVRHFDPHAQCLSKIERGFERDLEDVEAMLDRGLVERGRALELFVRIEPELYRFPAIDPPTLREKVERALR